MHVDLARVHLKEVLLYFEEYRDFGLKYSYVKAKETTDKYRMRIQNSFSQTNRKKSDRKRKRKKYSSTKKPKNQQKMPKKLYN
jgi:hypothetical protein